jgi:hypothetical protein
MEMQPFTGKDSNFAIWDDHDYVKIIAIAVLQQAKLLKAFKDFWAQ